MLERKATAYMNHYVATVYDCAYLKNSLNKKIKNKKLN